MPPSKTKPGSPHILICGQDDHAISQRASTLFKQWSADCPDYEQEVVDGAAANVSEARQALARCLESLQTLSFFGTGKLVWFRHCHFLGEDRMAESKDVVEGLAAMIEEINQAGEGRFRLLISAGKVDKRKSFFKQFQKLASVEVLDGWDASKSDWVSEAEQRVRAVFEMEGLHIEPEATSLLVQLVGPKPRQIEQETEKLLLYASYQEKSQATADDVRQVVSRNKQARAFALGDALGSRDLQAAMRCLDEELWEVRQDRQRSAIGLLYGLIAKVRTMILAKEMHQRGWLRPEKQFFRFKQQLEQVPRDAMPQDARFNPLKTNPFVLFRALNHSMAYQMSELIAAMQHLYRANYQLISTKMGDAQVLQQALVSIIASPAVLQGKRAS